MTEERRAGDGEAEADPAATELVEAVNVRLGEHLRRLRRQKGLSLLDVQALSQGEFKASVLGAYERGERAISAARLVRMAELYRLPLQVMLPPDDVPDDGPAAGVAVALASLDGTSGGEAAVVARFVSRLQAQRRDWTGKVFRIRDGDVLALASALDRSPSELVKLLDDLGLRAY